MTSAATASLDIEALSETMAVNQDVYLEESQKNITGGWERVFDSNAIPENRKEGFFGALYRKQNGDAEKWMICFRGYNGRSDIDDLYKAIWGDRLPDQVRDACVFTKTVLEKFGLDIANVDIVGHSMGGFLSKAVGLAFHANHVFAFSSLGLKKKDFPLLCELAQEFNKSAAGISEERLNDITTSIFSSNDITPRAGELHGQSHVLDTPQNPHLMKSLEVALLRMKGVKNPHAVSKVPLPERWGFKSFIHSIGVP